MKERCKRIGSQMSAGCSVRVTHHTSIAFLLLLLPTGNLEVQSSRTGKREDERWEGEGGERKQRQREEYYRRILH